MSIVKKLAPSLVCLLIFGCTALLQAQVDLEISETVPVANQGRTAILSPVKCDADGNVYMQMPDPTFFLSGPLLKMSPDGKKTIRYSLESVVERKKTSVADFAIGSRGEVYFLASVDGEGAYLIRFDDDGKYVSKTKLEKEFEPIRVGLFSTGDFLIAGRTADATSSRGTFSPLSALFDNQGRFVKKIVLPKDIKPASRKRRNASQEIDKEYDKAISGSLVESADDGNIYLARRSPKGPVYVVSPGGEILKRITLKPPDNAELSDIKVSQRQLVVVFLSKKSNNNGPIERVFLSVLDTSTGAPLAEYEHSSAQLGAVLACYVPNTFTFLAMGPNETLDIVRAKPR